MKSWTDNVLVICIPCGQTYDAKGCPKSCEKCGRPLWVESETGTVIKKTIETTADACVDGVNRV